MKTLILIALVLPAAISAQYKLGTNHLAYNKNATATELKEFTYENLRLYPIIARDSFKLAFRDLTKFTPLKQALDQKKVIITEKGDGGVVNTLTIENKSKDTIIVNCGEVVKGGQQDRVINTDMVLYPNSGKKDLAVFCVEHGRWSPRSEALANTPQGNRTQKKSPAKVEFEGYTYSALSLRKVVTKENNQTKVWDEVAKINHENKTTTETGTYTALDQSSKYSSKMSKYISFFKPKISANKDIVGVVVVTGDKVIGADIFATHDLFIQNLEGLLHSYATDAITHGKSVIIAQATVDKYINELLSDEKKQDETLKKKGSKFVNKGQKLRVSSFD
ncbi:MAG TPA: DUF6569 family protein [Chitinophagaceae bacterium]|jgi:hypothetical protein|nr:DUF6569 family protein [Chitinophagaceae bacterium]